MLDFGLAKAWSADAASAGSGGDLSQSPTLAHTGTAAGIILGTAAYMSPEQARGKFVDKRADIWAFGVLLYEMLSGRQLFAGDTVSDVLAGVLKTEIDLGALPESTPPAIRQLLRRCLERRAQDRLRDVGDARIAIDDLLRGADRDEPASIVAQRRRAPRSLVIGAACAGLVLAALLGYWAARRSEAGGAAPALHFERVTYRFGHFVNARFAPDGQAVFYAAAWEGRPRELFQARPGSGGELSLGQTGADLLSVSRTGELAILQPRMHTSNPYWKWGTLALLPASGGTPRELAEDVVWADWAPDGKSLAVIRNKDGGRQLEYPLGTVLVAREGTGPLRLFVVGFGTEPPRPFGTEIALRVANREVLPLSVSPDGRLVACAEATGGIAIVPIEGGDATRIPGVSADDLPIQWTADGRRLYVFDPGELPTRVFTVDIERGERRLVREIEPRDPVGVSGVDHLLITRDGQSYAYSYQQFFSDLFLVEGLR